MIKTETSPSVVSLMLLYFSKVVIPAKAGIHAMKRLLKISFTAWTPAFAGVTNVKAFAIRYARDAVR